MMVLLGLSGCGSHGGHHARAAQAAGGFTIVAGYDQNPQAMRTLADRYAPDMYCALSFEDLLRQGIDAVVIASPDEHHYPQLQTALTATPPVAVRVPTSPRPPVHVLIDKPVAVDSRDIGGALHAIGQARQRGQVVTSCHPRRFDPPYVWVKQNLARLEQEYGPLHQIQLDFVYGAPQAGWKGENRSLLLDHFSHELDILRYWLGDVPFAATPHFYDKPDIYYATVTLKRQNGTVFAACTGTRRDPQRRFDETIMLVFADTKVTIQTTPGTVVIEPFGQNPITLPDRFPTDHNGRLAGVMKAFADAINGGLDYLSLSDLQLNTVVPATLAMGEPYRYGP